MLDKKVVTRFAPSPTGFMHVGGVRTAIYAWLWARKNNGVFILRIEDTDKKREVAGSMEHIIASLKWLGVGWDEGPDIGGAHAPYKQSERLDTYKKYANILLEKGLAYADPYSEEEVENFRKKATEEKKPFLYREYRPENPPLWDGTRPLRLKANVKKYKWHDVVREDLEAGEEAVDDLILIKSDGYPTYNFAHIIDDLLMEVTHVVRGEEFISSTPNYLAIYEALGIQAPEFITVPPILGEAGTKKLGKRDGAKDILDYQKEGYLPEAMFNFLAFIGWNPGEGDNREVMTKEEIIKSFDLKHIQKGGAKFNEEKLDWLNKEHMKKLTDTEFIEKAKSFIDPEIIKTKNLTETELNKYILLFRDRIAKFGELNNLMRDIIFDDQTATIINDYLLPLKDPALRDVELLIPKELKGDNAAVVKYLTEAKKLMEENDWEKIIEKNDENPLWTYSGKEGRGKVLLPLRVALSGKDKSVDLFDIMKAIGKDSTLRRIQNAIDRLNIPEKELNTEAKNNIPTIINDPFTFIE